MGVAWENVTQIGCQFSKLSVLSYTLSNEWSNIIFLCKAGLNNTCGGPEYISFLVSCVVLCFYCCIFF
jgi:hypothetical protein